MVKEVKRKKVEKVIVFIDGNNLYHSLGRMFNNEKTDYFNFEKFIKYIVGDRKLVETYYYIASFDINYNPESYANQQKFFNKLRKIKDFNLIICRMQKIKVEGKFIYQVKEDDIRLALNMTELVDKYDTAILVSNDGDFVPAIESVQKKGKKVENIGIGSDFSYYLRQVCDRFKKLTKKDVSQVLGD